MVNNIFIDNGMIQQLKGAIIYHRKKVCAFLYIEKPFKFQICDMLLFDLEIVFQL